MNIDPVHQANRCDWTPGDARPLISWLSIKPWQQPRYPVKRYTFDQLTHKKRNYMKDSNVYKGDGIKNDITPKGFNKHPKDWPKIIFYSFWTAIALALIVFIFVGIGAIKNYRASTGLKIDPAKKSDTVVIYKYRDLSVRDSMIIDSNMQILAIREGFVDTIYPDTAGNGFIGYGHMVYSGDSLFIDTAFFNTHRWECPIRITQQKGDSMLYDDVRRRYEIILNHYQWKISFGTWKLFTSGRMPNG